MELMAILETLKYFKESTELKIYSDSQYVVGSILNGSAENWIKNNDLSKKNLDLWFPLIDLLHKHSVEFV